MGDRYFPNTLSDFVESTTHADEDGEAAISKDPQKSLELPMSETHNLLKAAIALKDEVVQATWIRHGPRVSDPTMYVGVLGTAYLCFKTYKVTGSADDLALCCDIVDSCAAAAEPMKQYVTFLCGQPGIYALGAAAAKCRGDQQQLERYLGLFNEIAKQRVLAVGPGEGGMGMPYELLYGRAGFLWAALFLNYHVGQETIPWSVTLKTGGTCCGAESCITLIAERKGPVVDAILAAGRAGSSHTQCPLMYQWHGTRYWGAAHGLAGIMHVLLHFPLNEEDADDVKGTLRYMIKGKFSSGNYPSSEGNARDRLIHWCHGAPGIAMTLCKAAQVFPECEEFQRAAIEAGDVVWNRGLLRRLGLCHGVSGNAYVFLSLYRAFGGARHVYRARQFARFLHKNARELIAAGDMHGGDHAHSLYEGWAGTACLWLDAVKPHDSRFPGYEL